MGVNMFQVSKSCSDKSVALSMSECCSVHFKTNMYVKSVMSGGQVNGNAHSPPAKKPSFNVKAGGTPGTPGSNRIHSIASLTPYQNR